MAVPAAVELVDLALKATTAYERPDLGARLGRTRKRLVDPDVRVLVVGEFKQGKSQLVNAPGRARPSARSTTTSPRPCPPSCGTPRPLDSALVRETPGGSPERTEVPVDELARARLRGGQPRQPGGVRHAEVGLPRPLLSGGLVLVDTPGVGGLASAHGAATMAALPRADAVLLVSDAAQEYTARSWSSSARRCGVPERGVRRHQDRPVPASGGASSSWTAGTSPRPGSAPRSSRCRRRCAGTPCCTQDAELNDESGIPASWSATCASGCWAGRPAGPPLDWCTTSWPSPSSSPRGMRAELAGRRTPSSSRR